MATNNRFDKAVARAKSRNLTMSLGQLKKANPEAFNAYVEMLVEDCPDRFFVVGRTIVAATTMDERPVLLSWEPDVAQGDMSVGAGWIRQDD